MNSPTRSACLSTPSSPSDDPPSIRSEGLLSVDRRASRSSFPSGHLAQVARHANDSMALRRSYGVMSSRKVPSDIREIVTVWPVKSVERSNGPRVGPQ